METAKSSQDRQGQQEEYPDAYYEGVRASWLGYERRQNPYPPDYNHRTAGPESDRCKHFWWLAGYHDADRLDNLAEMQSDI